MVALPGWSPSEDVLVPAPLHAWAVGLSVLLLTDETPKGLSNEPPHEGNMLAVLQCPAEAPQGHLSTSISPHTVCGTH